MIEIKDETEKVILVGVALSDQDDTKESLEELKDLVSTAGGRDGRNADPEPGTAASGNLCRKGKD